MVSRDKIHSRRTAVSETLSHHTALNRATSDERNNVETIGTKTYRECTALLKYAGSSLSLTL